MTWLWHSIWLKKSAKTVCSSPLLRRFGRILVRCILWRRRYCSMLWDREQGFQYQARGLSVTDYYKTLNGLWIELDQCQDLKMTFTTNSTTLTQFIERMRIFKFLFGLNFEFDLIRVQILGKEKLPSLLEVFYTVWGKETQRPVMLEGAVLLMVQP